MIERGADTLLLSYQTFGFIDDCVVYIVNLAGNAAPAKSPHRSASSGTHARIEIRSVQKRIEPLSEETRTARHKIAGLAMMNHRH